MLHSNYNLIILSKINWCTLNINIYLVIPVLVYARPGFPE